MAVTYIRCFIILNTLMEPLRASIKAVYVSFAQHLHSLSQVDIYRFVTQDLTAKQNGYTGAKWQCLVYDGVDRKANDWYDYSDEGSINVGRLFFEYCHNSNLNNRRVESGFFTYDVDLAIHMRQTNIACRRIRRVAVG